MKKLDLTSKRIASQIPKKSAEAEPEITNMMLDARYLRQSSSLIQESLQKGFDVLQLANGDIVATGTKTVVYHYSWDQEKGKLMKYKLDAGRKQRRANVEEDEEIENEDA